MHAMGPKPLDYLSKKASSSTHTAVLPSSAMFESWYLVCLYATTTEIVLMHGH